MKMRIGLILLVLFALLASPLCASEVRKELTDASTLAKVIADNKLRVGFSTFVPWAMKDKKGGYTGFEIEVAKQLATDMGVEVQFVPTKWSGIIPALLTGKFDIIIGGMGITPERNLKVNFSNPYEFTGMSIIANKKLAGSKMGLEAFNTAEMTISARIGTTAAAAAKKFLPKAQLRLFDDEGQALQEVLNNRAAAMVSSQPFPEFQTLKYADKTYLPLAGKTFTKEPIGFAIRKGDIDFLNYLNNWVLVKNSDGWLQERYDYWFTTQDWKSQVE
ncbi:amino acid ABC transporter substrate-binding protein, PAAT family [Malonomonas rubra DSM 5091]|uniref:Amino acid ABC transporter substrate-binding protein, PAAT family n=1 Tax=Malonomonas rubra DSM 5091 TaxID=1122189 RepID=A0A1M6JYX2_MALRU|nr:transporter substrate-binding domain-containing protein [Malonomonas rubra]SHJ51876.1 amino acid ABC transporter substrate-binding protein, PAAT family [Malonomonas rubra DSM 5091]